MALNLREIVAVSGRSGLFRVVSPARTGILVETLDDARTRTLIPANQPVSSLADISIYTTTEEGTVSLADVLTSIRQAQGPKVELTAKSDPQSLVAFIRQAVPDYDADRVYMSDIKKLVTWYNILGPHLPDPAAEEAAPAVEAAEAAAPEEAPAADAAPKKKAAKKPKADAGDLSTGGEVPAQAVDAADEKPVA